MKSQEANGGAKPIPSSVGQGTRPGRASDRHAVDRQTRHASRSRTGPRHDVFHPLNEKERLTTLDKLSQPILVGPSAPTRLPRPVAFTRSKDHLLYPPPLRDPFLHGRIITQRVIG